MLFHSAEFICIVLPVGLFGYYLLGANKESHAKFWLLFLSLAFYYCGQRSSISLLLGSMLFNYFLGSFLDRAPAGSRRKALLSIGILLNLSLLVFYKSLPLFLGDSAAANQVAIVDIFIPLGLSFFSLQQIAFLVDIYQKKIAREPFLNYALFVSFFPQLIAGPIVRYQELVPQIKNKVTYKFEYENLAVGSVIFILGAAKKIFCADRVGLVANAVYGSIAAGSAPTLVEAWVGAFSFTLQLYFDFSSYCDMAIGIARMFGIKLPINFNSPFRARGVTDGFSRWHITLFRYLSDYLVRPLFNFLVRIPLGKKIVRTRVALSIASFFLFLISGLWHGFSVNFILWGGLNAIVVVGFYLWKEFRRDKNFAHREDSKLTKNFRSLMLIVALIPIGVCFRAPDLSATRTMLASMAGLNGVSLTPVLGAALGWLQPFGIDFYGFFPICKDLGRMFFLKLLITPLIIVFFLPNIYELLCNFSPALGSERILTPNSRIQWQPSKKWAFIMAIITLIPICCSFNREYLVGMFEYFRF